MALSILYIVCLVVTSSTHAFFMQMAPVDTIFKYDEGKELCESHGMTLPVLHTAVDWTMFIDSVNNMTLSQGHGEWDFQPWLGLTHDGSSMTTAEHFTWSDGQVAQYVIASDTDMIPRVNDSQFRCVRKYYGNMRLTNCIWKRHLVCQGDPRNLTLTSPILYVKDSDHNEMTGWLQTSSRFVTATDHSQFPVPLNMCCLDVTMVDAIECFHLCSRSAFCHVVAVLRDRTSCLLQL